MSEEEKQKAVDSAKDVLGFAADKMEQYFEAAKQVLEQYGPDAVDLGLAALRVEAASELVLPLALFVVGCIVARKSFLFLNAEVPTGNDIETRKRYLDDSPETFSGMLALLLGSLFGLGGLVFLLDVWAWAGIFYPELYAVHEFILK